MNAFLTTKAAAEVIEGHVGPLTADEILLRKAVDRQLKKQLAEVHSRVEAGAKASAVPSKVEVWDKAMIAEVRPVWFGLFKKGGDRALKEIRWFPKGAGKSVKYTRDMIEKAKPASIVIPPWVEDPEVLAALEREMFKFAHGIDQTTADMLRETLIAGMDEGDTIGELANSISALSDEWIEGWRSEMIARTETTRAFTAGHIEAWRSTGVVSRKVWVAASDACPFCLEMNGTVVDLDETFFDQGEEQTADWKDQELSMSHDYSDVDGPPLHPNCRCALVAELDEQTQEET
jgi:hypothetical protein